MGIDWLTVHHQSNVTEFFLVQQAQVVLTLLAVVLDLRRIVILLVSVTILR